uniref:Uncharacterized protein n=1 Tax=Arundo donax TaxID=35708 RepID=A0A0A9ALR6_ARUDO
MLTVSIKQPSKFLCSELSLMETEDSEVLQYFE